MKLKKKPRNPESQMYRMEMTIRDKIEKGVPVVFEVTGDFTGSYADNCIHRISLRLWHETFVPMAQEKGLDYGKAYEEARSKGHLGYVRATTRTEEGVQRVWCHIDPGYPLRLLEEITPEVKKEKRELIEYHMNWNARQRRKRREG